MRLRKFGSILIILRYAPHFLSRPGNLWCPTENLKVLAKILKALRKNFSRPQKSNKIQRNFRKSIKNHCQIIGTPQGRHRASAVSYYNDITFLSCFLIGNGSPRGYVSSSVRRPTAPRRAHGAPRAPPARVPAQSKRAGAPPKRTHKILSTP